MVDYNVSILQISAFKMLPFVYRIIHYTNMCHNTNVALLILLFQNQKHTSGKVYRHMMHLLMVTPIVRHWDAA